MTQPIIVGGFYRSGTTLLRRILDAHSRIHCGPEVKFFKDFYGDYRDDPLAHARFFASARSYPVPEGWLLETFGRAFVAFHERAAQAAGKRRWADKNPENVLFLDAWESILPEGFFFIDVVRDPYDALASLVEIGFAKAVPAGFPEKVDLYARFRDAGARYLKAHPDNAVQISYEALARAPEQTVRDLMERLGEPFEPAMLSAINAPERGTGIEDPKAGTQASVHDRSVGRGARDLPEDARQLVGDRLAGYVT
jgi:hypothetical protein